jgi:hypothetical protein
LGFHTDGGTYYELGLCHALWKKVILLSQALDDVPFDLRQWRVILYELTSFTGAMRLKEELGRAIEALRQEKGVEAKLVELSSPQAEHGQAEHESKQQWLHGTIETWKPDRQYGFIKSGDESYWFNPDYYFSGEMIPVEDAKVVFTSIDPLPNAKNKRASSIFITGTKLRGRVNRILR